MLISALQNRQDREIKVLTSYFSDQVETRRSIDDEGASEKEENRRQWTEANLKSIHFTTVYFLVFFSIQLCLWIFLAFQFQKPLWLLFAYPGLILGRLLLNIGYWISRKTRKHTDVLFAQDCRAAFQRYIPFKLWFWRAGCYINLWSLRSIWLWTLQVSITTAFIKSWEDAVATHSATLEFDSVSLGKQLLASLLLALVAYIATNVVKEMLQMRVRYQDGVRTIQEMNESLVDQRDKISKVTEDLKNQASLILAISSVAKIEKLYKVLSEKIGADTKLPKLIANAFDNIRQEAEVIAGKMEKISTAQQQSMYLDVLNPYVTAELAAFQKDTEIVTRFSVAGQMVRGLLETAENDVVFYALLVIPPARFLNYSHVEGKKWEQLLGGDENWEAYLKANLSAVHRKVKVSRQFLTIESENGKIVELPSEAEELKLNLIEKQLKLFVECRIADGTPVRIDAMNSAIIDESGTTMGKKWKYQIVDVGSNSELPALPPERNTEWVQLAKVIGEKFHIQSNCFVRKITETEFSDTSQGIGKLLKDSVTGKPWDYFAARNDKSGDWLFCLRMRYDKDFDVAMLDIFYPQAANWSKIVDDLKELFEKKDGLVEITEFAKQIKAR